MTAVTIIDLRFFRGSIECNFSLLFFVQISRYLNHGKDLGPVFPVDRCNLGGLRVAIGIS